MTPTPTIATIYASGISIVTSSPSYDPTQQTKTWVRPLQPGEYPTDFWEYSYAVVDNSVPAPYVTWHTGGMTKQAAATANIQPSGYAPPSGVTPVTGAVPIPMDETKIPSGYTLTGTPFGLMLLANSAPTPTVSSTPDAAEQRILTGENEILGALNLPSV